MPGFRASARTVDLLGRQQIAGIPTAISELFKNAHDAYAQRVEVDLLRPQNLLVLRDDGMGMTEQEFVERWLTLGTESKVQGGGLGRPPKPTGARDRPVLGEKGIGRLAIASIGPQMLVVTRARRGTKLHKPVVALINWTLFEIPGINLDDILVPIHQLAAGALPDAGLVKAMAAEVLENLTAVASAAGAELVARAATQLEELTIDPAALDRLLREPTLSGDGQGTQFFVSPVEESLMADLDAESTEWGSSDVKRTLIGFANTMTPGHADERIATAFRDHRSAELVTNVIGPDEFFTPEEFAGADHHIQGTFDEYGQFAGTVAVFDQEPQEHRVPWPDARGRVLDCGPFRLNLAVVQGERQDSLLDRDVWIELTRKMNTIGGLYIYRDAIRVLPYGNADNDFLEIERNRTKNASRYYFSYRRMFGVVELDAAQNRALQEKAGREGFLDNRAYRQFRDVLRNFFVRTAYDYFAAEGSASGAYHETRDQLQTAHREAERKEKLKRQRARAFAVELETRFRQIQEGLPEQETASVLATLDDRLAAAAANRNTGHATEEFVRAEIEARRSLESVRVRYRLPAPRGLGLKRAVRNEAASYGREFERLEREVIQPAAEQIDVLVAARSDDLQLALDRRLRLEALVDDIARRSVATVGRSAKNARESARVVAEGVDRLATTSRRELESVISEVRAEIARLDVSSIAESELVASRLRFENVLDRTADHEQELLAAVIEQLGSVALSRNGGGDALTALQAQEHQEDKLLALEDRADVDLEMATQGLAIQVINHEFAHSIAAVRENLKRLSAWSQVNPDLRRLYGDIRASFDHLDGYLRLFTPMQRRLNRRRETITGGDVIGYLTDVFRRTIDEVEERGGTSPLRASTAFRQHEFVGYRSTFYPVFVNLVDNAMYWAERSDGPPRIELGVRGDMMTVCDNGPGIEPRHRDQVFEMGWTLKPGGRGAGLNISRQVLHAENWTLDVVASDPELALACSRDRLPTQMTDLEALCCAAARAFIQSAVVIDDEAGQLTDDAAPGAAAKLVSPALGGAAAEGVADQPSRPQPHPLRSKALVEAFAGLGVVCGILQPSLPVGDPVDSVLTQAVSRADVVILDWHLNDDGARALGYVRQILQADSERLRLIVIYTGDSALAEIAREIAKELGTTYSEHNPFVVLHGATRLAVFAKEVARDLGADPTRVLSEEDLPNQLVKEFAWANQGVVPAATMQALAAMRRNAHRMLLALGPELDVGFLGHRMLLPDPEDAEDHLLGLIVSEMESIVLEDRATRTIAGTAGAMAWLDKNIDADDEQPTRAELERCMTEGLKKAQVTEPGLKPFNKRTVTNALGDAAAGMQSGRDFAMRMTLRKSYEWPPKRLTFGCLLRDASDGYWLCVQPACDAVRLDEATPFPLLPCRIVNNETYHLVVCDKGVERRLTLDRKPRRLRMVGFPPDAGQRCVVANSSGVFVSVEEGDFVFVDQLKPGMSQQEAHGMGHAFSRPGIDASEFLRARER